MPPVEVKGRFKGRYPNVVSSATAESSSKGRAVFALLPCLPCLPCLCSCVLSISLCRESAGMVVQRTRRRKQDLSWLVMTPFVFLNTSFLSKKPEPEAHLQRHLVAERRGRRRTTCSRAPPSWVECDAAGECDGIPWISKNLPSMVSDLLLVC